MRELSLFTGAGGGLLGTKLLGWEHVGYVEFNEYCQRVLAQRIRDGILDDAPIFGDIRTFISGGYAESYQGMVDVITAGFPCQPFSVAGKRGGENDERNMWPETIAAIRIIRPRFALLENVPGLLAHEYGRTIFRDLAESGYECRWRVLSAAEMGAAHKRDRLWIVAHTDSVGRRQKQVSEPRCGNTPQLGNDGQEEHVADANSSYSRQGGSKQSKEQQPSGLCQNVPNSRKHGLQGRTEFVSGTKKSTGIISGGPPAGVSGEGVRSGNWWATEPNVGRVANGVAHWVDRLKAIGNGQVPAVVRAAWKLLTEGDQ